MTEHLLSLPKGTEVEVRVPVYKIHGEDYEYLFEQIRVNGYRRVRIDGKPRDLVQDREPWVCHACGRPMLTGWHPRCSSESCRRRSGRPSAGA